MFKNLIFAFLTISIIASCGEPKASGDNENQDQTSTETKEDGKHFGETIDNSAL